MGNCSCLPIGSGKLQAPGPIPKEVSNLFNAYAGGRGVLSDKDVQTFLKDQVGLPRRIMTLFDIALTSGLSTSGQFMQRMFVFAAVAVCFAILKGVSLQE
jgi:hypothetical protein